MARTDILPNGNNEKGDNKEKHKERAQIASTNVVDTQRRLRLPFRRIAVENADDAVDDELDAGLVFKFLRLGFDIVATVSRHDSRLIDDATG